MINKKVTGALLKILLVEDNPAHAELIIRSLEDHQIPNDIYHASDGEMALDYLFHREPYNDVSENPHPHVILLDIRMPKIDGLNVLREIKTAPELKHIPVVILTTSEADQDVAKAYNNYANSYLVKPVDFDKFMQLMDELGFYWLNWNHHQLT
jgi:CheY-like chemotaxis protein